MFRSLDVIIKQALEHFKKNIQVALLESISNFLHNIFKISAFIFKYIQNFKCR